MDFEGRTVVITGGGSGIGAALVTRFLAGGARVAALDLRFADDGGRAVQITCDVGSESAMEKALGDIKDRIGPVDIFVSNAGVLTGQPDHAASATPEDWARCWSVNVMAHVHAARLLLPSMIARKDGYFVIVASAAGLLNQIGHAAYSATKHAAASFAESLAITHGEDGIGVSLVCPQYVATPLIGLGDADATGTLLTADAVAGAVLDAVRERRFLVLTHPEVHGHAVARAQDHDRWIGGMRKLRRRALERFGRAGAEDLYKLL